jgi:Leucine Rich repeat
MNRIDGDLVASAFADMLLVNQSLTSLNMSSNWFTPMGITAIAVALHTNCTLLHIDLSLNNVLYVSGNDNFETKRGDAIASMLKVNTTLIKLSLHHTSLSKSNIESISLALHQNKSLQYLDIGHNYIIDDEIFGIIVNMLKINKTLKNLDVSGNDITSAGFKELACAFQHNIQLTHLNLLYNNIQIDGSTFLLSALNDWNDNLIKLNYNERFDNKNDIDIQRQVDKILTENALGTRVAPKKEEHRRHNIYNWMSKSWVIQKSSTTQLYK